MGIFTVPCRRKDKCSSDHLVSFLTSDLIIHMDPPGLPFAPFILPILHVPYSLDMFYTPPAFGLDCNSRVRGLRVCIVGFTAQSSVQDLLPSSMYETVTEAPLVSVAPCRQSYIIVSCVCV